MLALLETDVEESIKFDSYENLEDGEVDKSTNEYVDPFWEFFEDTKSPFVSIEKEGEFALLMKIIPSEFQDSFVKFGYGKINLKYKINADKIQRLLLYKLEDEFLQAGENDAD